MTHRRKIEDSFPETFDAKLAKKDPLVLTRANNLVISVLKQAKDWCYVGYIYDKCIGMRPTTVDSQLSKYIGTGLLERRYVDGYPQYRIKS